MRPQTTLRLSAEEMALLDRAARRLRLERASFIRAVALGAAELVLERALPLVLAVDPAALLRRAAARLEPQSKLARVTGEDTGGRREGTEHQRPQQAPRHRGAREARRRHGAGHDPRRPPAD